MTLVSDLLEHWEALSKIVNQVSIHSRSMAREQKNKRRHCLRCVIPAGILVASQDVFQVLDQLLLTPDYTRIAISVIITPEIQGVSDIRKPAIPFLQILGKIAHVVRQGNR